MKKQDLIDKYTEKLNCCYDIEKNLQLIRYESKAKFLIIDEAKYCSALEKNNNEINNLYGFLRDLETLDE